MELSVATDDFDRFLKENKAGWKLIDEALDRLNEDNQKNIDITYQNGAIKTCYEGGQRAKKCSTETQTDVPKVPTPLTVGTPSLRPTPPVSTSPKGENKADVGGLLGDSSIPSNLQNNIQRQLAELLANSQLGQNLKTTPLTDAFTKLPDLNKDTELNGTSEMGNGNHPMTIGDLPVSLLKPEGGQDLALGLYCYQCQTQFPDNFAFIDHLKTNELCKKMIRNVGLNYCFVCKKTYESVKKAKTHYTNYRNQGVNPNDYSRTLHRQWFDVIQFPTSRELENMNSTGTEVAPVQSAKCHGCQETFSSHDECIKHIAENSQCQVEIKHIGQTFCFVCERSYETEKQAETHYRNSIYNGHQLHRFHHRQYFNFVRQRKSPGRPPRSAESFAQRRPALMENSLLNFSLNGFEDFKQQGLPTMVPQMHQRPTLPIPTPTQPPPTQPPSTQPPSTQCSEISPNKEIKIEKPDEDKEDDAIEIIDVRPSQPSPGSVVPISTNPIPSSIPSALTNTSIPPQALGNANFLNGLNINGLNGQYFLNSTPSATFNCPICDMSFADENERFAHLSNINNPCHHQLPETLKTTCLICQRDLLTEQKLSLHLRLHKNEWHKQYYELFYRKRPGKRAAVDITPTAPDLKRLMNIVV